MNESSAVPIKPAGPQKPLPRAVAVAMRGCPRPYGNEQLNSRFPTPLPPGAWKVKWESQLNEKFPCCYILEGANRILLQGNGAWQLFTSEGKPIAMDFFGPSDLLLDSKRGLFHFANRNGRMQAYRLSDGKAEFHFSAYDTELYQRSFMAKRGRRMVIASFARKQPIQDTLPEHSVVQVLDLGDPPSVDREVLLSLKQEAIVEYQAPGLLAALNEDTLALAMPNRIVFTDLRLGAGAAFQDTFRPLALSMDEADRVYIIAGDRAPRSLWLLTNRGERIYSCDFPPELPVSIQPPVVGYDHRAYVNAGDRAVAIGPDGKIQWQQPAGGAIAGAGIASNDWLLVSAGMSVVAFDPAGQRKILHTFSGEPLLTAPVLTSEGEILVASARHLYRLTPSR